MNKWYIYISMIEPDVAQLILFYVFFFYILGWNNKAEYILEDDPEWLLRREATPPEETLDE